MTAPTTVRRPPARSTAPRSIERPAREQDAAEPATAHLAPVHPWRATAVMIGLAAVLAVMAVVSAGQGQLHVAPAEVMGSVLRRVGIELGGLPTHVNGEAVLWNIRFPRLTMGLLVGAALGTAGALMQGVFGNPLAEPAVIGVSSGAGVGACAVIVFGWTFFGTMTIPAAAFLTALLTTVVVYSLSRTGGRAEVVTLVLMGIAVNAVAAGTIALLVFLGDTAAREQIVFWQLGSLNGSRWDQVAVVGPLVAIGIVGSIALAKRLDLLALGERAARHLGVDVERLRLVAIVLVTLMVASGVAFAGIIGFVGLVVPHVVRMAIGPSHRTLVPASALAGAVVLTVADLVARTAVDYADLPIGMLTAIVGGPFFFWLLLRTRARSGGWG
jgi:iron complex transport system permease protein